MSTSASSPVALVTGGARRVGRAIVDDLAAHGWRVAVHANRSGEAAAGAVRDVEAAGGSAWAVTADLRDSPATRAMIDAVHARFGRLDAVVNSAAIWAPKRLEDVTADDVREHLEVNTVGTFVCCQHAGLIMCGQEQGGAIVNVGDWAITRPYRNHAAYFPSKGAIPTLTRALAVELAERNPRVRVNAVLPGPVLFPEGMTGAEREAAIASTLVQRAGCPEDLAHAVRFLIENPFVTGVSLPVDGGRTTYGGPDA